MAASIDWRSKCNEQPIFLKIRKNQEQDKSNTNSKSLLIIRNNELFVYDGSSHSVLTTNLHCFGEEKSASSKKRQPFQTLSCSQPPGFQVESILFNITGSHLALIGQTGITVLELPPHRGKYGEFAGGKDQIVCRAVSVAQRLFVTSGCKLLHAAWHPGSDTDLHLALLTSDNTIRLYNLMKPEQAEQSYILGTSCMSPSRLPIQRALGDSAAAFDFGPATSLSRKYSHESKSDAATETVVWPLYVLWGNGEVYLLYTSCERIPMKTDLQGPLVMYPAADDNYGSEACSILCLHTTPTVLILATCQGRLHHCIVLGNSDSPDTQYRDEEVDHDASIIYESLSQPSLYVYETVELELSLTTVSVNTAELELDDFTCPIRLHTESLDRYHCSHSAGVHTIVLPWMHDIQQFIVADECGKLGEWSQQQAIVEHLICTKPLPSSPPLPVLGLDVVSDRTLGTTLICLTATLQSITLPLQSSSSRRVSMPLLSSTSASHHHPASPLRHLQQEPFDVHIRRILQRTSSNPIILTEGKTDLTPQESFQLLRRATQVFREEYILKLGHARQEIDKRVDLLRQQKERLKADLQDCLQTRNILTERAGELAEKYTDCKDKQAELISRAEKALRVLQSHAPILTDAERSMSKQLQEMDSRLSEYKTAIKQLRIKQDYQTKQISQHKRTESKSVPFSKTQTESIRTLLKDEGEDIADLVKKVESLRTNLDLFQ